MHVLSQRPLRALACAFAVIALGGCPEPRGPEVPARAPLAQKWLDRAQKEYTGADVDEAWDAIKSALQAAPDDIEIKTWAGRIALARLEFAECVRLLGTLATSEARGLRGRAHWYAGEVNQAADELEAMLTDPDVHDSWAKVVAGLARRGAGRKPFQLSGALLAVTEMPHVLGTAMVVPLEIDGEQALGVVTTGTAEVTLDSSTRKEPSWVSLRFGGKVEIKDVPAMVQDLSKMSREMNAPIKALLGVNFLRHANVTFDFTGGQFIVRTFTPPTPPNATRVPVSYLKGGGMVIRSALRPEKDAPTTSLIVDTSQMFPIALDEEGWKKAGINLAKLQPVPNTPGIKAAELSIVRLGAFDVPMVPGVFGLPISDIERGLEVDLDGVLGSGLLAAFRVTMSDEGRALWLEDLPMPPSPTAPPSAGAGHDAPSLAPAPAPGTSPSPSAAPKAPVAPVKPAPKVGPRKKPSD